MSSVRCLSVRHTNTLEGFATPAGVALAQHTRFTLRRPVMVDPSANGADIEIPTLTVGAGPARLSSSWRHLARLAEFVNLPVTR